MQKILIYILVTNFIASASIYADDFNPFNVINPNRWFENRREDYDYYREPLPPLPPPGYGVPYLMPHANPYVNPYGTFYGYAAPAIPITPNYPPIIPNTAIKPEEHPSSLSKKQMESYIKELEARLEKIEAKNRQNVYAPKPATPSTNTNQYYSGDQLFNNATQYPFRPLDNER